MWKKRKKYLFRTTGLRRHCRRGRKHCIVEGENTVEEGHSEQQDSE
jgi:hypothetical protein